MHKKSITVAAGWFTFSFRCQPSEGVLRIIDAQCISATHDGSIALTIKLLILSVVSKRVWSSSEVIDPIHVAGPPSPPDPLSAGQEVRRLAGNVIEIWFKIHVYLQRVWKSPLQVQGCRKPLKLVSFACRLPIYDDARQVSSTGLTSWSLPQQLPLIESYHNLYRVQLDLQNCMGFRSNYGPGNASQTWAL